MKKSNIVRLTQLALLSAIVWLMAFTPLGYLKTAGVEITFIMIPVIIGAILMGPAGGAILGLEFGISSFIQCFGISAFGTTLFSVNPFCTFLVCIIPRVLAGWVPGLLFRALEQREHTPGNVLGCTLSALAGTLTNTVFFMALLVAFFWNSAYIVSMNAALGTTGVLPFVLAFVGLNGLIEIITAVVIVPPIAIAVRRMLHRLP